ncbi:MAG: SseB family protein, partial [Bacteroidetes bacterium]|nr:SseB family protein [Bacteroidota bacterium]
EKGSGDEPRVLFLESDEYVFLPIFSQKIFLIEWAAESMSRIDIYELSAIELLAGLGEHVTVALNPGTATYKEFNPEEILKLKTMVTKIQHLVQGI